MPPPLPETDVTAELAMPDPRSLMDRENVPEDHSA